jgi:hypothetical protein
VHFITGSFKIDGLDAEWNGTIGMHGADDVKNNLPPFALQHLYDASGIGSEKDLEELLEEQARAVPDDDVYNTNITTDRVVKKCSMQYFRQKINNAFWYTMVSLA